MRSLYSIHNRSEKTHSPDHDGQGNAFENAHRGTGMVSHRIGSGFWEGSAMRKRPVSIAILLLVLGFVLLYYTMQKQYMEFQNTCNQKMEELRNTALLGKQWPAGGQLRLRDILRRKRNCPAVHRSFSRGEVRRASSGPDVSGEGVPLDPDGVPVYG